jgi:hypothetical protein
MNLSIVKLANSRSTNPQTTLFYKKHRLTGKITELISELRPDSVPKVEKNVVDLLGLENSIIQTSQIKIIFVNNRG